MTRKQQPGRRPEPAAAFQWKHTLQALTGAAGKPGSHRLANIAAHGVGAIVRIENIQPNVQDGFQAPTTLRATPDILRLVINSLREADVDIVTLDEAHWRLAEGDFERRFVAFTLDGGYRDSIIHAYHILRDSNVPLAVSVPTEFGDGVGELWWVALERLINEVVELKVRIEGDLIAFPGETLSQKRETYQRLYAWLRSIEAPAARNFMREVCRGIGLDVPSLCNELVLSWDEVRMLAGDPLMTVVAHGRSHVALSSLTAGDAIFEITENLDRIEHETGFRPRHFVYPFGDPDSFSPRDERLLREHGVKLGLTTIPGVLTPEHARDLLTLPRIPLDQRMAEPHQLRRVLTGTGNAVRSKLGGGRGSRAA